MRRWTILSLSLQLVFPAYHLSGIAIGDGPPSNGLFNDDPAGSASGSGHGGHGVGAVGLPDLHGNLRPISLNFFGLN